jgi:hypothetical protein
MIRSFLVIATLICLVAVTAGVAMSGPGGDADDQPLKGSTLEKARAAALAQTGGGVVTETEIGDDGAAYGVEIVLGNGSEVEVSLDAKFNVVSQEADDGPGDDDETRGGNDDLGDD